MTTKSNTISVERTAAELVDGDLIVINGYGELAFVCCIDAEAGEISYRDVEGGDYHERTAHETYTVYLQHPAIDARRAA